MDQRVPNFPVLTNGVDAMVTSLAEQQTRLPADRLTRLGVSYVTLLQTDFTPDELAGMLCVALDRLMTVRIENMRDTW